MNFSSPGLMIRVVSAVVVLSSLAAWSEAPKKAEAPKPAEPRALVVGVVASLNDQKAQDQAAAFGGWVRGALGKPAREQIFQDYELLAVAVAKGEVDVALMGPLAYLRIDPKTKPVLLGRMVRKGKPTYRAVLFAKAGSPLKSLEVLRKTKNLSVGWVDPSSATGYILPKSQLILAGIDPVQIFVSQDFAGSHDAVCKGVAEGKWDLGATFADGAAPTPAKASGCAGALGPKADALTILTTTSDIPNDVLVASAGLPKDQADKLASEARGLGGTEPGKKLLQAAFFAEGVTEVTEADFAPVRKALDAFKR